jgi:hypothetical protein
MTLVEFLAPLKNSRSNRNKCLAALYYRKHYEGTATMAVGELSAALGRARVPKAARVNVADVVAKAGEYVDSPGVDEQGRRLWQLTDTGDRFVRDLLSLPQAEPEIEHDVGALMSLAAKVSDETVRGYVEEAIKCLRAGALRAAVVFLWTGAIRTLHERALKDSKTLNDALQKQDPKVRRVSTIEHFGWIADRVFLEATPDMGLLDKGEKDTLVEALNLRNRCGHPTKYTPREAKVRGFTEDVLGIVFV